MGSRRSSRAPRHTPFVPLQPHPKTALEDTTLFFKLQFTVAQVCKGLAFFGQIHGHAVVARAFLLKQRLALAQFAELAQGGVEGRLAAPAF